MFKNVLHTTIGAGAAESGVINMSDILPSAGMVKVPSAWTAANIGFMVAETADGTFVPLRNQQGNLVEISGVQTGAGAWYRMPAELLGAMYVKVWSQTSGVAANQAAARSLVISGKG